LDSGGAKVAIITGAGSGIGRATVEAFIETGISVAAIDRSAPGLHETEREIPDPRLRTLLVDVTAPDAPDRIVSFALESFGRINYLVNNAGIGAADRVDRTSDESWDRYLDVNLRAAFRLCRSVLPHLQQPHAAIVSTASTFGIVGQPGSAPYAASKAGLIGLTRQMAADYGPLGIRVNAVAPGLIETPLTRSRLEDPAFRRLVVDKTPFPRIGTPRDVACAIRFLCSEDASFINGHTLTVDGGWSVTNYVRPLVG
jgi:NAD(P)-dependent dehydrogenase (short-subunit alcohol dehydrogenase family)